MNIIPFYINIENTSPNKRWDIPVFEKDYDQKEKIGLSYHSSYYFSYKRVLDLKNENTGIVIHKIKMGILSKNDDDKKQQSLSALQLSYQIKKKYVRQIIYPDCVRQINNSLIQDTQEFDIGLELSRNILINIEYVMPETSLHIYLF